MNRMLGYALALVIAMFMFLYKWFTGSFDSRKPKTGSAQAAETDVTAVDPDEMEERSIEVPFSRTLNDDSRELPYRSTPGRLRLQIHIGQRKLLLNEIEFLTLYGDLSKKVLYVGSTPGYHIRLLAKMFPEHHFTLYDPRDFGVKEGKQITLRQQWFTEDDAKEWAATPHLFISDIRNAETYVRGKATAQDDAHEDEIAKDMEMQKTWVEIANPLMAMLKFRLSWKDATQEYFDGKVYIQPWAYKGSTETRLITDGKTYKTWDARKYERQMYRHNAVTRIAYYDIDPHIVAKVPGMDHCYDCKSEVEILTAWATKFNKPHAPKDIVRYMNDNTKYTGNRSLKIPPHGEKPYIKDITERIKSIHSASNIS